MTIKTFYIGYGIFAAIWLSGLYLIVPAVHRWLVKNRWARPCE